MRSLGLAALLTMFANIAVGQTTAVAEWPLDSGSKVRVLAATLGPHFRSGTLVSTSEESILIATGKNGDLTVPTDKITMIAVARGTHTSKAKYMFAGLVLGGLAGALVGAASYSPTKCTTGEWCFDMGQEFSVAAGAILFGGAGAVVGLIAGASPKDNWISVPLPAR